MPASWFIGSRRLSRSHENDTFKREVVIYQIGEGGKGFFSVCNQRLPTSDKSLKGMSFFPVNHQLSRIAREFSPNTSFSCRQAINIVILSTLSSCLHCHLVILSTVDSVILSTLDFLFLVESTQYYHVKNMQIQIWKLSSNQVWTFC